MENKPIITSEMLRVATVKALPKNVMALVGDGQLVLSKINGGIVHCPNCDHDLWTWTCLAHGPDPVVIVCRKCRERLIDLFDCSNQKQE